jgi:transcriptional regulator with XRE-family HTH domain
MKKLGIFFNFTSRITGLGGRSMIINERLKALMSEKGVTWKQISEELKIGKNQPKYWEEKDTLPDGKTLIKLSQYFGVTVDYLLGVEDQNAALMKRAFDILDGDTSEQEKALLAMFRSTSEEGRLRIIQSVMNICDEIEKKPTTSVTEDVG